jgi:hypothetical protein
MGEIFIFREKSSSGALLFIENNLRVLDIAP